MLHLLDSAQALIDNLSMSSPEVKVKSSESTRVLKDRMMAIEQDHRRLSKVVQHKTAIDCEMSDFRTNERFEDWFLISGLARISETRLSKTFRRLSFCSWVASCPSSSCRTQRRGCPAPL